MAGALQIILFIILLIVLHELAHIVCARVLGIPIQRIGLTTSPYPHIYVLIKWPKESRKKYCYLYAGTFITLGGFLVFSFYHFFNNQFLFYAYVIQIVFETNPFYSDFTISMATRISLKKEVKSYAQYYKEQLNMYQFSLPWYIHFLIWTIIILVLINLKGHIL